MIHSISINESELLSFLDDKSFQGLNILYTNYAEALLTGIYLIVEDYDVAENLLMENFIYIWNNFTAYDAGKSRFIVWVITITLCKAHNHKNNHIQSDSLKEVFTHIVLKNKFIMYLLVFAGLTQTEISSELNMPAGTVKSTARNVVNELRQSDTIRII